MKKKSITSYYIMLMLILQVFVGAVAVSAISRSQSGAISDHCAVILDNLRDLQRSDSRTRVYLGRYYETISTKYIVPLNLRLVENNLSNADLIDNQSNFNDMRAKFIADYIEYQKGLEGLVAIDCKAEPDKFYNELTIVRTRRSAVAEDVSKLNGMASKQIELVKKLEMGL